MISTLISFDLSAVRAVSLGLATATMLAACNTDSPLEPSTRSATIPSAPSAAVGGSANASATTGDLTWKVTKFGSPTILLGGATFRVQGARMSKLVVDNGTNDSDPALGKFKVFGLQPGTFTVCELTAPTGYVVPTPACHTLTVSANTTTSDEFVNKTLPVAILDMRNIVSPHALVGGGYIKIRAGGPTGATVADIQDNDAKDINKTAGVFAVNLPGEGTYSVCVRLAPPGYYFVQPYVVCHTIAFQAGQGWGLGTYYVQALAI